MWTTIEHRARGRAAGFCRPSSCLGVTSVCLVLVLFETSPRISACGCDQKLSHRVRCCSSHSHRVHLAMAVPVPRRVELRWSSPHSDAHDTRTSSTLRASDSPFCPPRTSTHRPNPVVLRPAHPTSQRIYIQSSAHALCRLPTFKLSLPPRRLALTLALALALTLTRTLALTLTLTLTLTRTQTL